MRSDGLPIILGEAPGPSGGTGDPLGAKTARRLARLAGWEPELFEEDGYRAALAKRFELRNLLDRNPGKTEGKGMRFPAAEARSKAQELDLRGRTVVLLGKRVAAAVGAPTDYFRWERACGARCVTIPHPSGINRVLNDPKMQELTGLVLRQAAEFPLGHPAEPEIQWDK